MSRCTRPPPSKREGPTNNGPPFFGCAPPPWRNERERALDHLVSSYRQGSEAMKWAAVFPGHLRAVNIESTTKAPAFWLRATAPGKRKPTILEGTPVFRLAPLLRRSGGRARRGFCRVTAPEKQEATSTGSHSSPLHTPLQ